MECAAISTLLMVFEYVGTIPTGNLSENFLRYYKTIWELFSISR